MRARIAIGLAAVVLGACGSSAASSSTTVAHPGPPPPGSPPCGPASARTLAASRQGRMYAVGHRVLGCARGGHRSFVLLTAAPGPGGARLGPVKVSGRLAAFAAMRSLVDAGRAEVTVTRLSDGKVLAQQPATTSPLRPESFVSVPALVLAGDGALAWISVASSIIGHQQTVQVHALDRRGSRVLDAGPAVAPGQLELVGGRVRWRHGGVWRSARLA